MDPASACIVKEEHDGCNRRCPRIIGVGSAGKKIIQNIARKRPGQSSYLAIDTEPLHQGASPEIRGFVIGDQTKPRPFHRIPLEWARQAVIDVEKSLKEELAGSGLTFIVAGMGGGVGTGASPAVAGLCKSIGAFTIALLSMPFPFEGSRIARIAETGLEAIKSVADVTLVIRHERILKMVPPSTRLQETYEFANEIFSSAVEGILELKTERRGSCYFDGYTECLKILIPKKTYGYVGIGSAEHLPEAMMRAMTCPLLSDTLPKVSEVLLLLRTPGSTELEDIDKSYKLLNQKIPENAEIFSGVFDSGDQCKVILYALKYLEAFPAEKPA